MLSIYSGEKKFGVVVAFFVAIIPFGICAAAPETARVFALSADEIQASYGRMAVAVPNCGGIDVALNHDGLRLPAEVVETAYVRGQKIAVIEVAEAAELTGDVCLRLNFAEPEGEVCVDAGPLTGVLGRTLLGYGLKPQLIPPGGPGTVARCQNLIECRNAKPDVLLICGTCVFPSTDVDSMASLWAQRMGLNVAIIDVANISLYSPIEIRDFIKNLYDMACAEHFGDGHLGFVVLLGDAYEDDNTTKMVPEYDGYGSRSEASDHFYACVSGTDDFEDLMIGRIPVGNQSELASYYDKLASYTPLAAEAWAKSILFAGGCFFAAREDYVAYFDSLEDYVPEDYSVSRFYRYDYPHDDTGDADACQAIIDSLDAGKFLLLYSGDGDRWDWGARFERVFKSRRIPDLDNSSRLPIVLSISCSNGWFDNVSVTYEDGGVDCFAERLLTTPQVGAIACLASSREAGGGASTVLAPEIIKSAFVNGSSFLGELILEAKTRHLIKLGRVEFARQFNLFGDPCLNFVLNELPITAADLVIRPYGVEVIPEFPIPGETITLKAEIWNASGVPIGEFDVSVYSGHPDSGGSVLGEQTLEDFWGWERRQVEFHLAEITAGDLDLWVIADPDNQVSELAESNNTVMRETYVYPCEIGFPIKIGDDVKGQVVADLDCDGNLDILVTSGGRQAWGIGLDGTPIWVRDDLGLPQWFDGVEPSVFDLNGDGAAEAVITTRSGIAVLEAATGNTIWQCYTEYPVLSPVVTDIESDGSSEILLPTFSFSYSRIHAFNASGSYLWGYQVPGYAEKLTGVVVGDIELDGYKEVVFGTDDGNLTCLNCSAQDPTVRWQVPLSADAISFVAGGDLERDGSIEIVASSDSILYIVNSEDGSVDSYTPLPSPATYIALGDMDGDLAIEVLCVSAAGEIFEVDDGSVVLTLDTGAAPAGSPALADIDQDGTIEIISASQEGQVRVINPCLGDLIPPVPMRGPCLCGPSVCDADGDGNIEIVSGSSDSLLFVLDLGMPGGVVEWYCKGCTGLRTGLYAQPLFGSLAGEFTLHDRIDAVGDVVVEQGGMLTLERGTNIRFVSDAVYSAGPAAGQCELMIDGYMVARGCQTAAVVLEPLVFPYGNDEWSGVLIGPTGSASITRTRISGAITGIECLSTDVYISECEIVGCTLGIKSDDSSPLIDHNTISGNSYGISASGGQPIIIGNMMESNVYSGVILSSSCDAILQKNTMRSTAQGHGLSCYTSSPLLTQDNRLEFNSLCGMYLSNSSPSIDSCWIGYNGDCGIKASYYSGPVISKTSIVANRIGVGVYLNAEPVLGDTETEQGRLNDIRQNTMYAIYNTTTKEVKAQENWWGSDTPDPGQFLGPTDYSYWLVMPPAGIDDECAQSALVQALFPNPFGHMLSVDLAPARDHLPVRAAVYDVRGRLVRDLATIDVPVRTRLQWDGRDNNGRRVASGAYIISIDSKTRTETRKVILLH